MPGAYERILSGTNQVAQVTNDIGEIERRLTAIATAAQETSDALSEQRATSHVVAKHMEQIASAASENSAAAAQVVGEAGSVSQAAEVLRQRVGRFILQAGS